MKTFILIHGSWHSAWNWHLVVPILESNGHKAIAIDLPGMGLDKMPIQQVQLATSVEKLTALIDEIEEQVILVAHSKNGIVISQAAEYRPHKIEKLIYLAAYLIPNGKTQQEYSAMDTEGVLKPYVTIHPKTQSHILQPAIYKEGLYHDCDPSIAAMARYILGHEPIASGITPLQLTKDRYETVPRYYIECTQDRAVTPFIQQLMYTTMPCQKVYTLATSHSPFFSQPHALVAIFLDIAQATPIQSIELDYAGENGN
jgi:pimeloyl-ACP methyl ester carboxylesterase